MASRHRGRQQGVVEQVVDERKRRKTSDRSARAAFIGLITWATVQVTRILPTPSRVPVAVGVGLVVFTALSLWETRQHFTRSVGRHVKPDHRR